MRTFILLCFLLVSLFLQLSSSSTALLLRRQFPMLLQLVNPQCVSQPGSSYDAFVQFKVFMKNHINLYACIICLDSQNQYMPLSRAATHEDLKSHVDHVRKMDREPAPMSSPLHVASELGSEAGSPSSHSRFASPTPSGIPASSLPTSDLFDLFGGRPTQSVHGPALPSDDPNQIYDDFAGELAQNRPSPNESSEFDSSDDEDAYNTWQKPESDDIMPEEHPESDGLLYQYDDRFAEEQRSKISVSTRIYV
jgi:hypothetical protein